MLDLEQMTQWWMYLWFCLDDGVLSPQCNSHWSTVVLSSFVLGLLMLLAAGYGFYKVHREVRRSRFRAAVRDIAALEDSVAEASRKDSEGFVRLLAEKYRKAFERSGLTGWHIHGDT